MKTWLETVIKHRVRKATYLDYKDRVRLYITPAIGNVKLSNLKPKMIQVLYSEMIDKGLSARSVRYAHTILRNSLQQAVKWELINKNPADLVADELPKNKREEMKVLTKEEASTFLDPGVNGISFWQRGISFFKAFDQFGVDDEKFDIGDIN